jgi:hypothetical protein
MRHRPWGETSDASAQRIYGCKAGATGFCNVRYKFETAAVAALTVK